MEGEEEAHQGEAVEEAHQGEAVEVVVVVVVGMGEARTRIVEASWFGTFLVIADQKNFEGYLRDLEL